LPFANLSKDPEQQYFADAITDDLTTDLSRISGSFVIAATTAFTYKGKGLGANQNGHELGVRYVLEGSVRHTGDHVQVNVQLIDGESGTHLCRPVRKPSRQCRESSERNHRPPRADAEP
jgi:adenylate cyclase